MNKLAAAFLLVGGTAYAGGMFLPFRGVRETGRGGAFVAGADDASAMWDDPAGLAELAGGDSKEELLIDASYVGHSVAYTRIDSGGNTQPTVHDSPQATPIPTLAAAFDLGKRVVLAVGVLAPDAALDNYPENGPQRYSLVTLDNTVIAIAEAAIGVKVTDSLSLGVGFQDMIVAFHSRTTFSACPSQVTCAPEDPDYDALGEIQGNDYFAPSAVLGAQLKLGPKVRLGAAFQLPFHVSMNGTIRTRLPSSGFYNGASVMGDQAAMSMTFPAMARFGIEVRPKPTVRVEAAFDAEFWSEQDALRVTPHDVYVANTPGVGTYELGPIIIPREFDNTYSFRLGLEAKATRKLTVRAGYVFETGAAPLDYLSVITVDTPKHILTVGLGYQFGKVRLDATFAHVFNLTETVPFGTSCAPQINPVRSGAGDSATTCVHDGAPDHVYVGDGTYASSWNVFGVGATMDF